MFGWFNSTEGFLQELRALRLSGWLTVVFARSWGSGEVPESFRTMLCQFLKRGQRSPLKKKKKKKDDYNIIKVNIHKLMRKNTPMDCRSGW